MCVSLSRQSPRYNMSVAAGDRGDDVSSYSTYGYSVRSTRATWYFGTKRTHGHRYVLYVQRSGNI